MDLDLGKALQDAAREGTAHRTPLRPAPVMQRIRRRRTVRVVGESTVGVAAAGAVALGVVQVADGRWFDPAPPAVSKPTPSDDAPLPVVTSGPFGCDLPVPAIDDPAGDADLHVEPVVQVQTADGTTAATSGPTTMRPTDGLVLDAVLVNGTGRDLDATTSGNGPRVWFAQDGVVVGSWLTTLEARPDLELVGPSGTRWSQPRYGQPMPCAVPPPPPDGSLPFVSMPTGTYEVYVSQDVRLADGRTVSVAGGPLSVVIEGEPQIPDDPPTDVPPTDGPPTVAHPDLESLTISPAGLGPLTVGVAPDRNPGAAMIEFDPDFCDVGLDDGDPGRWVAAGYDDVVLEGGSPRAPFTVDADDQGVYRIDVVVPEVRTAEGVGIGTTVGDLRAAYPGLEGPYESGISRVWWLRGPSGTLVFETQGDENGLQPPGTPEQVVLVRVLDPRTDPAFSTANSDDVAGGCL